MNHLSRYCRSKRYRKSGSQRNVLDVELNVDPPTEQMEEFHIESIRLPRIFKMRFTQRQM